MSPIFALITVFLESLGILDIFAILSSILLVVGSRQYMVPALLKFQIAAGDRPCFIFSNRDGLFVMVTMGGDLQPGCLADRLLTGLGQPQINP
jgi:hypothetical protein